MNERSPTPSGLLFDIGHELQVLAFGAPVDRPRIVRLLERIKEEKPVSEIEEKHDQAIKAIDKDYHAGIGRIQSAAREIHSSTHGEGHTTGVGGHEERVTVITPSDKNGSSTPRADAHLAHLNLPDGRKIGIPDQTVKLLHQLERELAEANDLCRRAGVDLLEMEGRLKKASAASATPFIVTDDLLDAVLAHQHGAAWKKVYSQTYENAMRNDLRVVIERALAVSRYVSKSPSDG